ncbi:unnamed protein product [Peronospora belbahrii]|uniref:FHA domain-containing protein n=1 Tax=Peronospora belbahrii TaxID=622444 RepID=A0ABN8CYD1_9STRA|nr:unnamed protein product [Peronospora belbahrii]
MSSSPPPWGRLILLGHTNYMSLPKYYDLVHYNHCIGRAASRCDIQIPKEYISGLHCIIRLLGKKNNETPFVEIVDHSRYGTWVNLDKVGLQRTASLKHNDKIHFTRPDAKNGTELVYRFEILCSGLMKVNENLYAQLIADEMPVANRTRKRTHEETQCTQSPLKTKLLPLPPRPVKKRRRDNEEAVEPVSEPLAVQSAWDSRSLQSPTAKVAGRKRRSPDALAPNSNLVQYRKGYDKLRDNFKKELELFRDENAALKKAYLEELAKVKADAAAKLAKVRAEAAANLAKVNAEAAANLAKVKAEAAANLAKIKAEAANLAKIKAEAAKLAKGNRLTTAKLADGNSRVAAELGDTKKELLKLREERDGLKQTINQILQGPNLPRKKRNVTDLKAKVHVLKRTIRAGQDDLTSETRQERAQMTPLSEKQPTEIGKEACGRTTNHKASPVHIKRQRIETQGKIDKAMRKKESTVLVSSALSVSSQSQDSIDSGILHNAHRSSLQLSFVSNEHSEPSPGDIPQKFDAAAKETKNSNVSEGRSLMFNIYGAGSATVDSPGNRLTMHCRSLLYRTSLKSNSATIQESQGQEKDVKDKEPKGSE